MRYILLLLLLVVSPVFAQVDAPEELDEILLKGNFSKQLNSGYVIQLIPDSLLIKNQQSLTDLLRNEANLYFRENGYGMVSSVSLRGTTASQTGVFWNGIPINSQLNGQTDFNTIFSSGFSEVEIRRGGASVLLGNGAIGGAVNISERIQFGEQWGLDAMAGYGSFDTWRGKFSGQWSNERFFASLSLGGIRSENDYPYPNSDLVNENGAFSNGSVNAVAAWKLNAQNQLSFHAMLSDTDRDLSRTLSVLSSDNLTNTDQRYLLEHKYLGDRFTTNVQLAYLEEEFRYLFDRDRPENFSVGESRRFIAKVDGTYYLNKSILFRSGFNYTGSQGSGSNFDQVRQDDFTFYLLFQHRPGERIEYNLSSRLGASSAYSIPVIFAGDVKYALSSSVDIRAAASNNYRLPTFNDLYWEPGGNPDLKPETSFSTEAGLDGRYKFLKAGLGFFWIKSKDLIQWRPGANDIWSPVNVRSSRNYGFEVYLSGAHSWPRQKLSYRLQYDFTKAIDDDLDKQLIYVPEHRASASVAYSWRGWQVDWRWQALGKVYTTTSNSQSLDPYQLSDLSLAKSLGRTGLSFTAGVRNLFDQAYQVVAFRPMPGRNYFIQCNLNLNK